MRKRLWAVNGLATAYVLMRHQETAVALTNVLCDRIADALPRDRFSVSAAGLALSVQEVGSGGRGIVCTPALGLIKGHDNGERLRVACELAAESVGPCIAPNEEAHVKVTDDAVAIWWGGPLESEAVVRLSAISRRDVCI